MIGLAIAIITAPRAKPTLRDSVKSFKQAGFQCAAVFAEPGSEIVADDGIEYRQNEMKKGNFRNWVAALQTLVQTPADWLMICEDDISWAYDASDVLYTDLMDYKGDGRVGAISLYLPIRMSMQLEKDHGGLLNAGWYQANLGRSTWGAQCLIFHRNWAAALLQSKQMAFYLADPRWEKNVDALVADVLLQNKKEILYRVPCLVDHTFGEGNSSLGYRPDRPKLKTRYFREHAS